MSLESWRRTTAAGAVVTGLALGMQQVFQPRHDEPGIIIDYAGDPPVLEPLTLFFHPTVPEATLVLLWR